MVEVTMIIVAPNLEDAKDLIYVAEHQLLDSLVWDLHIITPILDPAQTDHERDIALAEVLRHHVANDIESEWLAFPNETWTAGTLGDLLYFVRQSDAPADPGYSVTRRETWLEANPA